MDVTTLVLALAVLVTAEFCAEPFEGGIGEPRFCRVNALQDIATTFFSVIVEPNFLVGVHRHGRRMQIQSTLWQSQDHMLVEILDGTNRPDREDCPEITVRIEDGVSTQDCRISKDGMHDRGMFVSRNGRHVLIRYSYTS